MNPLVAAVVPGLPFAAAIALGLIGDRRIRGWPIGIWVNLAAAGATLLAALGFAVQPPASSSALLLADPLARHFALLAGFIGFTAACAELGRPPAQEPAWRPHLALALGQAFLGAVLAALMTNSLVVTVVAAEAASLALAVAAALPRTPDAMRTAWTRMVTAGLAGGLALFGVILLSVAALPAQGPNAPALTWTTLPEAAAASQGALLSLGSVLLLVGAGAMAMLAPLHLWISDPGQAPPAPAMTAPLMTTLAITVILRLRQAIADNADAVVPGPTVLLLGLFALLIAALALGRQRDARRFVAVATIGQGGIVAIAIGLGTSAAVFAGVLHLTLATLVLTALLSPAATGIRMGGGQAANRRSLAGSAGLGLTIAAGLIALAGLPPFGLFSSVLLIVMAAAHGAPLLLVPLGAGLGLGAWAMLARLPTPGLPGAATSRPEPAPRAAPWAQTMIVVPMIVVPWLHLALTALLGLAMPIPLVRWFATIAGSLG